MQKQMVRGGIVLVIVAGGTMLRVQAGAPFDYHAERFADAVVMRYEVPGFATLTLRQKHLAYCLTEAGLAGRDILWDQKYRHNLAVRKMLEGVLQSYSGDRHGPDWEAFVAYAKQVFFSNGIHHSYKNTKLIPGFPPAFLRQLLAGSEAAQLPLEGRTVGELADWLIPILFDPALDGKAVNLDSQVDNVTASAAHFYVGVTAAEVAAYYAGMAAGAADAGLSFGLNSQLAKVDGRLVERRWKVGGMYGPALAEVVVWLKRALPLAENANQQEALRHLIRFYETGDLAEFDRHSIAWVADVESRVDFVNGFIEVFRDPAQLRGAFESVVLMRDDVATKRIAAISREAQWFEDHSTTAAAHKKPAVTGISARVATMINASGDLAPEPALGINLPNANWIREKHGSKSTNFSNVMSVYNTLKMADAVIAEFHPDPAVAARQKQWGALADDIETDLHEVVGHASGRIVPGVERAEVSLRGYAGTLEEVRADLVALYFMLDPKLVEIGVLPTLDVGRAQYDSAITRGLLEQLFQVEPGQQLEQAHMRNRQICAAWAYAHGQAENVISRGSRDGKTYFHINDYGKLRGLFGVLLREVQRIVSEGDFAAAQALVETYGVKVDQDLLREVHRRYAALDMPPYAGVVQPRLVPEMRDGELVDVRIEYPEDFLAQMLEFGRVYGFLPVQN